MDTCVHDWVDVTTFAEVAEGKRRSICVLCAAEEIEFRTPCKVVVDGVSRCLADHGHSGGHILSGGVGA